VKADIGAKSCKLPNQHIGSSPTDTDRYIGFSKWLISVHNQEKSRKIWLKLEVN